MIRAEWRLFLTAVQFLTRCPIPAWVGHSPAQLNRATRYFPLVGGCVGLWGAAVFALAGAGLPVLVAALLLWRRAHVIVVVLAAAGVTALLRAVF